MQQGVEKSLRERFQNLQSVIAINHIRHSDISTPEDAERFSRLTKMKIEQILERLGPTIKALGGKVVIQSFSSETGKITVEFSGPDKLRKGLEVIISENEAVKSVEFVPFSD
jgi:Fe-S cluster biogenesis protein NfuA